MKKSNCKLTFNKLRSAKLEVFAEGLLAGLYVQVLVFVTPTVSKTIFQGLYDDYAAARTAYENGGKAQLLAYQKTMAALKEAITTLATYVDGIADGSIATIKMAGFEATNDPSNPKPGPSKVQGLTLVNEKFQVQQLVSDCESFPAGTQFVGILSEGEALPSAVTIDAHGVISIPGTVANRILVHSSKQRKKVFNNLTSGTYYYGYYFIINKLGASQISNAVKTMCL